MLRTLSRWILSLVLGLPAAAWAASDLAPEYRVVRDTIVPAGQTVAVPYLMLEPTAGPVRRERSLLIFLYGSGGSIESYNLSRPPYRGLRQRLAAQGFFILVPELGRTPWMNAAARSLLDQEVAQVIRDYPIDRHHVHVMGTSMGGASSLAYAIHRPDLIRSVCAVLPVVDLVGWYEKTPKYHPPIEGAYGGTPAQVPAAYHENSAIEHPGLLAKIPIFLVAGGSDHLVPAADCRRLAQLLQAHGGRVVYREAPGLGHEDEVFAPCGDEAADLMLSAEK